MPRVCDRPTVFGSDGGIRDHTTIGWPAFERTVRSKRIDISDPRCAAACPVSLERCENKVHGFSTDRGVSFALCSAASCRMSRVNDGKNHCKQWIGWWAL